MAVPWCLWQCPFPWKAVAKGTALGKLEAPQPHSVWGQVPFKVGTFAFGEQHPGKNQKSKRGWWRPSTSTWKVSDHKETAMSGTSSSFLWPVATESPGTELIQNNWRCTAYNDRYLTQGGLTVTILSPLTPLLLKWLPIHLIILTLSKEP